MFFLYRKKYNDKFLKKNNTLNDKPSPTNIKGFCQNRFSYNIKSIKNYIGRISRLFSFKGLRGSMTVEASLVLPLFLFFFLQMSGFIEMLRLHGNLQYGLWRAGKTLMLYGAVEEVAESIPQVAVSYGYVGSVLSGLLGEEYLDSSPLTYGREGINYLESDILTENGEVNLTITYQVTPRGLLFPFTYARLSNRFYGRAWTGYDLSGDRENVVYVTDYGEVWHSSRECTHLRLSVQKVSVSGLKEYENVWGRSYEKCSFCTDGAMPGQVYITDEGDCFHYKESCLGLTRHVKSITWEEREKYRPCSRCGEMQ